ncbi:MAG: MoaD/ThiS family protein [Verrucomicrobiota bacterium]
MRVLLFSQARDAVGAAELSLPLSEPASADELWTQLLKAEPRLARLRPITRLARNGEYADAQTRFHDADEVALIPPVSGG